MDKFKQVIFYQGVLIGKESHLSISTEMNKNSSGRALEVVSIDRIAGGFCITKGEHKVFVPDNNIVAAAYDTQPLVAVKDEPAKKAK